MDQTVLAQHSAEQLKFLRNSKTQMGFSLLEVLVSVVILSFGLLGVVGLQAASLKANREAQFQSTGVRLARELGELIRGNKAIGIKPLSADNPYLASMTSTSALPTATTNCIALSGDCYSGTDPAANQKLLAEWQMRDWLFRLRSTLPGARAVVCFDNAPYDSDGLPRWACDTSGGSGGVLVIKIGWTKSAIKSDSTGANSFDKASTPSVVFPVTAGSTT